jgi:hypothetical protein
MDDMGWLLIWLLLSLLLLLLRMLQLLAVAAFATVDSSCL